MVRVQVPYDAAWPRPGGGRHCECCVRRSYASSSVATLVVSSVRPRALIQGAVRGDIDVTQASLS